MKRFSAPNTDIVGSCGESGGFCSGDGWWNVVLESWFRYNMWLDGAGNHAGGASLNVVRPFRIALCNHSAYPLAFLIRSSE